MTTRGLDVTLARAKAPECCPPSTRSAVPSFRAQLESSGVTVRPGTTSAGQPGRSGLRPPGARSDSDGPGGQKVTLRRPGPGSHRGPTQDQPSQSAPAPPWGTRRDQREAAMRTGLARRLCGGDCVGTATGCSAETWLPGATTAHTQGRVAGRTPPRAPRSSPAARAPRSVKVFATPPPAPAPRPDATAAGYEAEYRRMGGRRPQGLLPQAATASRAVPETADPGFCNGVQSSAQATPR